MAQLTVDNGGSPGINCRRFCEYCYFKKVRCVELNGCKYSLPFKKVCDFGICGVNGEYGGFKDPKLIAGEIAYLQEKCGDLGWITIIDGGDRFCYLWFEELIELLGSMEVLIHIITRMVKSGTIVLLRKCSLGKGLSEMKVVE
jgi:NifB/MoaA-like Fe-S oxidoreductase